METTKTPKYKETPRQKEYRRKWRKDHPDAVKRWAKKWVDKNPEKTRLYAKRRGVKVRELWRKIFEERNMMRCSICGYDRCFDAIDFHHVGNDKKANIAKLRIFSPTEEALEELSKCIAVCANCHREIHARMREDGAEQS